jgi:hypothetical protein
MRDLNYDFKQLCRRNRDGSYATQADREHILDLCADQLHEMGVRGLHAQGFKPKHVKKLVDHWLAEELAPGTIKNRMSQLRWLAQKIGKENIVERTNAAYGIPDRVYVSNVSKAKDLDSKQLDEMRSPYTQMSVRLADGFGLRREACIKMVPGKADQSDVLVLKASLEQGRPRNPGSHPHPRTAPAPRGSEGFSEGQEPGGTRLQDLLRVSQALPRRVRAGRHQRRARLSPSLRAAAIPRAHRLGVSCAWRADVEAAHQAAEDHRSRGAGGD